MALLIPGSSFYQLIQSQKLYAETLGTALPVSLPANLNTEKFYKTCRAIHQLNAQGYLACLAKIIVGLSIVFFYSPMGIGLVGIGLCLEGCFHGACSIYHTRQCHEIEDANAPLNKQNGWEKVFEKSPVLKKWFETEFCSIRKNNGYKSNPGNLPPLNQSQIEQAKEFYEIISSMSIDHVISSKDNTSAYVWTDVKSIKTFPSARLDDFGVDVILKLLFKSYSREEVSAANSRLYDSTISSAKDRTSQISWPEQIFINGKLFVPIIENKAHITLIVADFQNKIIQHFDSLGSPRMTAMNKVGDWLNWQCKIRGGEEIKWNMSVPEHTSHQDLDDCTIFTLYFAESLLEERVQKLGSHYYDFNFQPENIPYYRLILLYRLSENLSWKKS